MEVQADSRDDHVLLPWWAQAKRGMRVMRGNVFVLFSDRVTSTKRVTVTRSNVFFSRALGDIIKSIFYFHDNMRLIIINKNSN